MSQGLRLHVNGKEAWVPAEPDAPLLYVLRNDLALNGPKFGCGIGQCGACTVLVDGRPTRSCMTPAGEVVGRQITTLEGLGTLTHLHPIQEAFLTEQAAQCGYCMNGILLAAKALLDRNPNPTEKDIRQALNGYLCRCGSHLRVIRAVQRAARGAGATAAPMPGQPMTNSPWSPREVAQR